MVYSVWIAEVTHYDSVEERLLIFVGLDVLGLEILGTHSMCWLIKWFLDIGVPVSQR